MTTQHDERPTAGSVVPTQDSPARRSTRPGPRALIAGIAVAVLAAGGIGAAAMTGAFSAGSPAGPSGAAVDLPAKVGGLAAATEDEDFGAQPAWLAKAQAATGGATVVGRQYGSAKERKTIRVVAARTDLTGKLELAWAADTGTKHGDARCTQNFVLTDGGKAAVRPTMLLCWRTSDTFSAYSLVIDFDHTPSMKEAVQAVDDVWGTA